eukprot:4741628-Amphidinium_carterae.1
MVGGFAPACQRHCRGPAPCCSRVRGKLRSSNWAAISGVVWRPGVYSVRVSVWASERTEWGVRA